MDDKVRITLVKNPFDTYGSREVLDVPAINNLPAGRYIDYLKCGLEEYDFVVSVNGKVLEEDIVDLYPVMEGDNIVFIPIPSGGEGGGKVLRSIAMLAVVVVAGVFGGPLGAAIGFSGGLATAVGSTVIMGVGGLLINAILPPTKQDLSSLPYSTDFSESATYSWQAIANPS
jgi:hypothetical protein